MWETSEKFGPYTGNMRYKTRPMQCVGVHTIIRAKYNYNLQWYCGGSVDGAVWLIRLSNTLSDICVEQYRHLNNIHNCQKKVLEPQ
jgi:hypothetical protein